MRRLRNKWTGEIRQTDGETRIEDGEAYIRTVETYPNGPDVYGPDGICKVHNAPTVIKRWEMQSDWEEA